MKFNFLILVITLLLFANCKQRNEPWTIIWSSQTYSFSEDTNTPVQFFYLEEYAELKDTGRVKYMTRKQWQAEKEFYSFEVPDSIREKIAHLANNENTFKKPQDNNDPSRLYCGFTYKIELQTDTISKFVFFTPPVSYEPQRDLLNLFENLLLSQYTSRHL